MTAKISVLDPTAAERSQSHQKRRTLDGLKGKVVGFIDNSKPNFNYLVDDLAELMEQSYGVKATFKYSKRIASIPASDEAMDDLTGNCDLVITGAGD